ncbi:MAG: hypothetical protein U9Q38_02075 [Thermodesulfobacteriota bacterium]|nr:hypothetical protein [Thermodesulfobacteriota bacterium]
MLIGSFYNLPLIPPEADFGVDTGAELVEARVDVNGDGRIGLEEVAETFSARPEQVVILAAL